LARRAQEHDAEEPMPISSATALPFATTLLPPTTAKGPQKSAAAAPAASPATLDAMVSGKKVVALDDRREDPRSKPFGDYALPDSEMHVAGQKDAQTSDLHGSLLVGLSDLLAKTVSAQSFAWVSQRATALQAKPEQSLFVGMLGPDFDQKLHSALSEAFLARPAQNLVAAHYGPQAAALTDTAKSVAISLMLGAVRGDEPSLAQVVAPFGGGKSPELSAQNLGTRGVAILEASLEYFIAAAGGLMHADLSKDLDVMSQRLDELKAEKKAIIAKLINEQAGIAGLQKSQADAVKKAQEAKECSRVWSIVGSVFAIAVAIAVAVVVSVATFGSGAPAMATAVCAVFGAVLTVPLMITAAVAAVVIAITTLATNLPNLLRAVSALLRAMGAGSLAEALDKAADGIDKWMMDNAWFGKLLAGLQITATIAMAAIMVPMALTKAVDGSVRSMMLLINLINAGGALVNGAVKVMSASLAKRSAQLQREIDSLKAQLQEIEVEIKKLSNDMASLRDDEKSTQDDVASRQDMEGRVMDTMQKTADLVHACFPSLLG
jgi:hypothetical protein